MPILQLPVFEKEADPAFRSALTDDEAYARLQPPKTLVVRFGSMKLIGEFPYDGTAKPGCGSKLVARTHRGTELAEMLTTTCANSGCGKSVSRKDMLDYIQNSGGKDFPFHTRGTILRVATIDDLNAHSALLADKPRYLKFAREQTMALNLALHITDVEPILGGEVLTFYYMSEGRIDFRELAEKLAEEFKTRIELWQVGARDEARLKADYEKCGQHCCCKNFLKVLKPVSMRQAKQQKGTLDPLKISGRCGRLMCCLRYEDTTYQELKAKLPGKGTRVGTSEGVGVVVDTKILVQLVLVRLEGGEEDGRGREIAVPVEELMTPEEALRAVAGKEQREQPMRAMREDEVRRRMERGGDPRARQERFRDRDRDGRQRSVDAGEARGDDRRGAQRDERSARDDRDRREGQTAEGRERGKEGSREGGREEGRRSGRRGRGRRRGRGGGRSPDDDRGRIEG